MGRQKLDAIDLRILKALQRDGRMTKARLAEAAHLSPSACWQRLKRLEDEGVIAGYHARINPRKLGPSALVMVEVELRGHRAIDFERFEAVVRDMPEIVECQATGGGIDYLLKVVAPDVDAYQRLIDTLLERDLGIERYYSYIVTKTVKDGSLLPLERLSKGSS